MIDIEDLKREFRATAQHCQNAGCLMTATPEAMLVLIEALEAAGDKPWQPIDSAPKDGRWIFAMFDRYTVRWVDNGWVKGWDNGNDRMVTPKYWMPIPPLNGPKP